MFVEFEVVFYFLGSMLSEIGKGIDMVHTFVIREDGDDLVIAFSTIFKFHHTDDTSFDETSWDERFGDICYHEVEHIIVLIPCLWDKSVCDRVCKRGISDTVKFELACLGDKFIFIDRVSIDLDETMDDFLLLIGKGRENMLEIEHVLGWGVIDVCHNDNKKRNKKSLHSYEYKEYAVFVQGDYHFILHTTLCSPLISLIS